jgi:hypothetical protein
MSSEVTFAIWVAVAYLAALIIKNFIPLTTLL